MAVKAKIEKLREQGHHLNRMERMEQQAPDLFLMEADPGQIIFLKGDGRQETRTPSNSQFAERTLAPPTRSVVFRLGAPDRGRAATTWQQVVARMDLDRGPPG